MRCYAAREMNMIKVFCDICEEEITGRNDIRFDRGDDRLKATLEGKYQIKGKPKLGVEIITSKNGVSNSGNFCKYCVLDALYKLDDRPRCESAA